MSRVYRHDTSPLSKVSFTPQGFARIQGRLTRTGVLTYRHADGSITRELRHPDDVFHPDSLATLSGAPVTDLHPKALVTSRNVQQLGAGHVAEGSVKQDGRFVGAQLTVTREDLIGKVRSRDRRELSCGYVCDTVREDGEFDGERYDTRQKNITYNHVAVGPVGWGRAGGDVALRVDGGDGEELPGAIARLDQKTETHTMAIKLKIDGVEHTFENETTAQAVGHALKTRDDAQAVVVGERDALKDKVGTLTTERDDIKTKLDAATDPKATQARIDARVALVTGAGKVLGDKVKLDDKTDREIQEAVLSKIAPSVKFDEQAGAYVQAAYDTAIGMYKADSDDDEDKGNSAKVKDALKKGREDSVDDGEAEQVRKDASKVSAEAWKTPLRHSTQQAAAE